ncbi:bifunctional DNA primase/polymerase [Candidatus Magnetaquicoccus inordinatus]|uniref:bifunctional DNA primase/polymerase n=1 Tax=Candidatus Magnetaquicoccus inordinatus TaxID=2496818 RepID=UPI00102C6EC1|nr:bifunctional DNA primase/polymerase [Candidatus Magnetaquicoccus inordinatus]
MDILSTACKIASLGGKIFPLLPNGKTPLKSGWQDMASSNPEEIELMLKNKRLNYGVTSLFVIDVDMKNGKNGVESLNKLSNEFGGLPSTLTVSTPSGGFHYYFQLIADIGNSVGAIGEGLDIRSVGGYVVGPESIIDGRKYSIITDTTALPELPVNWKNHFISCKQRYTPVSERIKPAHCPVPNDFGIEQPAYIDSKESITIASRYLKEVAPPSIEGNGGDANSIKVIRKVRDYGVSESKCFELLLEFWNQRCVPPWSNYELLKKVSSGYKNAQNKAGCLSPHSFFSAIK